MFGFGWLLIGTFVATLTLSSAGAWAAGCQGRIDTATTRTSMDYDPSAITDPSHDLVVRIVNTAATPCRFRLALHRSPDHDPRLGGALGYVIEDENGTRLLDDWPASDPPTIYVETVDIPAGGDRTVVLKWKIGAGQMVPPGIYTDDVQFRLYAAPSWTLVHRDDVTLRARVRAVVSASLAGADLTGRYRYRIDFGDLTTGEQRRVVLRVRTNSGYRIDIESDNRGQLTGPQRGTGSRWTIPYTVELDGRRLALDVGVAQQNFGVPGSGEGMHELRITIGTVENRRAGIYRDVLRITVTPNP